MITPDNNNLYHPATTDEIIELVKYASANKLQIRVRGAAQSVDEGIYTDGYQNGNGGTKNINIVLNRMRQVQFTPGSAEVKVQAGCNIGFDPYALPDPRDAEAISTETNGLFYQLQNQGLAIPNVTDAIHQTVGGFICTGSSAGSTHHSFYDSITSLSLVDGSGNLRTFNRPVPDNPDDPFYAVILSLGLLGIITEITFTCIPAFNVIGQQAISDDTAAEFDMFGNGNGKPSLQKYLSDTEFARMIWWPFPTVRRLISWKARTMQPSDYNAQTGTPENFLPKPYQDAFYPSFLPEGFKGLPKEIAETSTELVASSIYYSLGHWPQVLYDLTGNEISIGSKNIPTSVLQSLIELAWPKLLPHILNVFAPVDGSNPPQTFWDRWPGLANDTNEYSNNLLAAYRTEFWVPISHTQPVMTMLDEFYKNHFFQEGNASNRNFSNGCYVVEILGAKQTSCWLGPSYGEDCLRINFYSLHQNDEKINDYFSQFWDLFYQSKIPFRMHWGYYLPPAASKEGYNYLSTQYPKWKEFSELRKTMDPQNVFVNSYWQSQLNL